MLLALDIGNTLVFGGVIIDHQIKFCYRKTTQLGISSDEFGLFLRQVLRENNLDYQQVTDIVISSVVPEMLHSTSSAAIKYFDIEPLILRPNQQNLIQVNYKNSAELGADRIGNAIGACYLYPNQNIIIIDYGTATTFCAISRDQEYMGGVIIPGINLAMKSLETGTSKLPTVEIKVPDQVIGHTTVSSIQSGLYHGTLGASYHIVNQLKEKAFSNEHCLIIGTGGFARLFLGTPLFDHFEPELILQGLSVYQEATVQKKQKIR